MTFFAETLEKNRDDGVGLHNMIVFSFLLHALILSIIFFSPSLPEPKWTFGPTYTVDLVSLPSRSVEVRSSEKISREVVGMQRKTHSMIMKKEVGASSYTPVREAKTLRKKSKTVDTAIESIKKKVTAASASPPPASISRSASGSEAVSDKPQPVASSDHPELNLQMKVYYSVVWSMIKEQWALPEGILNKDNLETVIEAKILKDGKVASLSFEKRSGNRYFDASAVKAIKKVGEFPALPEWLGKKHLDLGIRFRSSDF